MAVKEDMKKCERLKAAIQCQEVDRIPISVLGITPYGRALQVQDPAYKKALSVIKNRCDYMVKWWSSPGILHGDPGVCNVRSSEKKTGNTVETTQIFETPMGELTSITIQDASVSGSDAPIKHLVENLEDAKKLLSIPYKPLRPDLSEYFSLKKELGEDGLMYFNGISSPVELLMKYFNYEFLLEFCLMYPEMLKEFIQRIMPNSKDYITYLLNSGVKDVYRLYNIEPFTEPIMSLEFVKEYIVPFDRQIVKMIHDGGALVINHCHGRLKANLENFMEIGVNGIDCPEPPPANDCDLKYMKEKTKNKICFLGYIQWEDLERESPEKIVQLTNEAIEMGGKRGYILSQSASVHLDILSPKFVENLIVMIETGWKHGR